jgi:hypothetical protein
MNPRPADYFELEATTTTRLAAVEPVTLALNT